MSSSHKKSMENNTHPTVIEMSRDLSEARNAHQRGDVQASILAHSQSTISTKVDEVTGLVHSAAKEKHSTEMGQYIKSIVYGGLDGIITSFAVVAGGQGGALSTGGIIIIGISSVIADGFAMGAGDFLSSKAEMDYAMNERKREEWETDNYLEGEKQEMIEIYQAKGMSLKDATQIIDIMAQYRDVFVDAMMVDELGIQPADPSDSPLKNGLVTFASFVFFGWIVFIPYIFGANKMFDNAFKSIQAKHHIDLPFVLSTILSALALFGLGAAKSRFTGQKWFVSGLGVLGVGGFAAGLAFLVGYIVPLIFPDAKGMV